MTKKDELTALQVAKDRLKEFLDVSPGSFIIEADLSAGVQQIVGRPWKDKSLAFAIPDGDDEIYSVLNSLILPERFSAIYHKLSSKLEVIWTAHKLSEDQQVISGRAFVFNYKGLSHKCHFSRSSNELLKLAATMIPLEMSITNFRNLQSFNLYTKKQNDKSLNFPSIDEPLSFWIENVEWNLDQVVDLVNNMNFYLNYYDTEGAMILIHPIDEGHPHPKCRYIEGKFPKALNGKALDNNLLSFWTAANEGDSARRFQYYYRIIEYTSFFYLENASKMAVRRILAAPSVVDDITATTERLMEAFQLSKIDEYAKFSQLMLDTVDPKMLWREIKENVSHYSKEIKFDGGFTLKPIISATMKESAFLPKGVENFTRAIRDIRNALSHGRDFKTASVIMPTAKNLKALQPWVHVIAVAAGQVVLFKDIS